MTLCRENYGVPTIPPGIGLSFGNVSDGLAVVANFCSIVHDPEESENVPVEQANFGWPKVIND